MITTFPDLLARQVRTDGSRPLVTFYDDATGERVELSVLTYANWVAKTAGLLQDELELGRGARVRMDLPTHWLAPVWLGAVWSVGGVAVTAGPADAVVCGPDGVAEAAAAGVPAVALSLRPMGARFADPLPAGVLDYGVAVWGQPDAFVAWEQPEASDDAWVTDGRAWTQAEVCALRVPGLGPGDRLLTDVAPTSPDGPATLLGPLAEGGGTVWVRHPDDERWGRRAEEERTVVTLRA